VPEMILLSLSHRAIQRHLLLMTTISSISWLWLVFACRASSLALNSVTSIDLARSLNVRAPLTIPSGISRATGLNNDEPYCEAEIYGRPLLDSCRQAWEQIPDDTALLSFRERPRRFGTSVTVPYRWVSREYMIVSQTKSWFQ